MGRGIVLGIKKGKKVRVRYPAMTSGYISYTYASIAAAKRHVKDLGRWQRRRAKITKV